MRQIAKMLVVAAAAAFTAMANASVIQIPYQDLPADAPAAIDIDDNDKKAIVGFPNWQAILEEGAPTGEAFICDGAGMDMECSTRILPINPAPSEDAEEPRVTAFGTAVALSSRWAAISQAVRPKKEGNEPVVVKRETVIYERIKGAWHRKGVIERAGGDIEIVDNELFVSDVSFSSVTIYNLANLQLMKHIKGEDGSRFGASIRRSGNGNLVFIGAPEESVSGLAKAGAVYVFQKTGTEWGMTTKFVSPTPTPGGRFGRAIASKGEHLFVSEPGDSHITGSVMIYKMAVRQNGVITLSPPYRIYPETRRQAFGFGIPVVPGDDRVLIGAIGITGDLNDASMSIYHLGEQDEWFSKVTFFPTDDRWKITKEITGLQEQRDDVSSALGAIFTPEPDRNLSPREIPEDGVSDTGGGAMMWMVAVLLLRLWGRLPSPSSRSRA